MKLCGIRECRAKS